MEWFELEGTFAGHPVQPPAVSRDIFTWIMSLRALSNLTWNVHRDGTSTTSLDNPCQGFTTLTFLGGFKNATLILLLLGIMEN